MSDYFRTPDERFENLPGFPWEPRYSDWEGLRLARIDEGPGSPGDDPTGDDPAATSASERPPIVLFHGEPTWSFLYRKVIPPLLDAGHRCIAPDYPGFGRSDKPTDFDWYSYDRHTEAMTHLLGELGVEGATFVMQDWGGPIGMRVAAESPELCARMVIMDTGLFTGRQKMSDAWKTFRDFVERTEDLPISMLVGGACASDPSEEILAGYDAPFPGPEAKAGARAFPLILPTSPEDPGADAGQRTAEKLADDDRPVLVLWADSDPVLTLDMGKKLAERMSWPEPVQIKDASHFLQEDQGEEIGRRVADWHAA